MLTVYFIAGLFGNFVSLSFNTTTISVGASGAIFGLIGSIFCDDVCFKTFNKKNVGAVINCISDISWCFSVYVKYKYCGAYWRIHWWFI